MFESQRRNFPGQLEEIDRAYKMYPHHTDDEFVREFIERDKGERHTVSAEALA